MKTNFKIFLIVALSFLSSFNLSANDTFFSIENKGNRVCELANGVDDLTDILKPLKSKYTDDVLDALKKDFPNATDLKKIVDDGLVDAWASVKHVSDVTRRNPEFLKFFDNIRNNGSLKKHIFEGEIVGGKVTGLHYKQAVDGENVRFVDNAIPEGNSLGVLKGDIEFRRELFKPGKVPFDPPQYKWTKKNIPGGDPQTFFPSTWSQDEILEQCASALANPKKKLVPGKTRMFEAESNSGIFMRWFEDANGNVTSIFPEF